MIKPVLICTCIVFSAVIFIQTNTHSEKYTVGGQTIQIYFGKIGKS
jgi:hypothetical protein